MSCLLRVLLSMSCLTSVALADSLQSASELVQFYAKEYVLEQRPAATRGIAAGQSPIADPGRGIAGVRKGKTAPAAELAGSAASGAGTSSRPVSPEIVAAESARPASVVDFHNIVFPSGSYSIPAESYRQLDEIGTALSLLGDTFPDVHFVIEGHTDNLGGAHENRELSFNRANAIRRYLLVKHGVEPSHLEAVGMGEGQPVSSNSTRQGRARNRRVSIRNNRNP